MHCPYLSRKRLRYPENPYHIKILTTNFLCHFKVMFPFYMHETHKRSNVSGYFLMFNKMYFNYYITSKSNCNDYIFSYHYMVSVNNYKLNNIFTFFIMLTENLKYPFIYFHIVVWNRVDVYRSWNFVLGKSNKILIVS